MTDCIFCRIVTRQEPAEVVYEDDVCMAFLDKYPQARGQLQLIPKKHYRWIYEVPEIGQIFATAGKIIRAIIPVLGADHATLATFGRQVAHAHIWIVPQYQTSQGFREFGKETVTEDTTLASELRNAIVKGV